MIFIGIDPGLSGAVAAVDEQGLPFGDDWWIKGGQPMHEIADFIRSINYQTMDSVFVMIEDVHAMPISKSSPVAMFKLGHSKGFYTGLVTAMQLRFELVRASQWQKKMGCIWPANRAKPTTTQKKNLNKSTAQMIWPQIKITHANADAILIAEYCRRQAIELRIFGGSS